ncbi:unnamed protein product [Caenorhabditis sp. 36 PRJEB53466]|nr:unnamed protein product [Caenorhabditis sp. 36 PRJEB53466]
MASAEDIFHFLARNASEDSISSAPEGFALAPKPQILGSIPTKVITSCKRSVVAASLVDSSSSSRSTSDSEEESESRKRPSTVSGEIERESVIRPKVIKMTKAELDMPSSEELDEELIRCIPLRPVCSVYMVSYNQEFPIDVHAKDIPELIKTQVAGLNIGIENVSIPVFPTYAERLAEHQKRRNLEQYIFSDRYKTVWHAEIRNEDGKSVRMTVPFTVDVADIFNSFTKTTVPMEIKEKTYEYAVSKAKKISEFRDVFSMNNPNVSRRPSSIIKRNKQSCIVSTGSCPSLPNSV